MTEPDFQELAALMADVVLHAKNVKAEVSALRRRFVEMQYCFSDDQFDDLMQKLHQIV